jgi:hypothetical protein
MLENIGLTRFADITPGRLGCPVGNDIIIIALVVDYATTAKNHPLEPAQKTHHSPL